MARQPRQARTTENLKERVADALIELLAEKPYADISVSEIVDRADVGRATYYRHFTSKDEVIIYKFRVIFEREIDVDIDIETPFIHRTPDSLRRLFSNYLENLAASRDVFETVYAAGLDYLLFMYMYRQTLVGTEDVELVDRYRIALHSASIFAVVDQWITSGFAQSPDELITMLMTQVPPPRPGKDGAPADQERSRRPMPGPWGPGLRRGCAPTPDSARDGVPDVARDEAPVEAPTERADAVPEFATR